MPSATATQEYLSKAQVQELRDGLTMLDVYRARKSSDPSERGLAAFYQAALRLELIPEGTDLEGFLVRLRTSDFNQVMAEGELVARIPLAPVGNGGEKELTSADGTG